MIGLGYNNCASNGGELMCFSFRNGTLIVLYGQLLTIAGIIAATRYGASVTLDQSLGIREHMAKWRRACWKVASEEKRVWRKHRS
jgi:hypothetical protein